MFGLVDMIVIEVIERGLENLRLNPHHLEFILGGYHQSKFLTKLHGGRYVQQCVDYITQNKIHVEPYYVLDTNRIPNIAVLATYHEDTQFFGDYGSTCSTLSMQPKCYAHFDASNISTDKLSLFISSSYKIEDTIRIGMLVVNGEFSASVTSVFVRDGLTEIYVNKKLPQKLKGWKIQSIATPKYTQTASSLNSANVMIKMKSSGDIEVHKLLCLVLRYCLRFGRVQLDSLGLQNTKLSQEMTVLEDPDQSIFATSFSISGVIADTWINAESEGPAFINLKICAVPVEVEPDGIVEL